MGGAILGGGGGRTFILGGMLLWGNILGGILRVEGISTWGGISFNLFWVGHLLGEFITGEYILGGGAFIHGGFFQEGSILGGSFIGGHFSERIYSGGLFIAGGTDFSIYWRGIFMEASISGGQFSGGVALLLGGIYCWGIYRPLYVPRIRKLSPWFHFRRYPSVTKFKNSNIFQRNIIRASNN